MAGPIAYYEVRWRPSDSDGEWMYRTFPPESTTVQITNVDRSKSYVIEARSVGPSGLKSIWVNISHTVEGNAVPEVPGALSAVGTADAVKLAWTFALPMPADTMVCIERATAAGGPWTEIVRVRALSHIVTEKVDGTFYYRARTVNFRGDFSGYSAVVSGNPETVAEINASISTALNTAQNAQATADGKIQTFWQPAAPVIGSGTGEAKVGDIWFDTDDGNKIWRVVGSSWTKADDDDMAQAIALANNAQTTADGKVEMFVGSTAPTSGMNLSDLWFDTVNKALFRWDGDVWTNRIADVTADQIGGSGVNLVPDKWSTAESTTLPAWAVNAGTISRVAGPISGGQWRITATGINAYAEPSGSDSQFPIDRTKKYLLSAYVTSSAAIGPGGIAMALRTQPGSGFTASDSVVGVAANVRTRVYAVIDGASTPAGATTASVFILFNSSANGQTIDIDGYMVEELIGNKITPSSYSRGSAAGQSLTALIAAQNAQATADGAIDIYRQPTAPAGAKLGDYWQDSDDGRWWYYNGSSWGESPDNRLPQVVIDAANAQSAANTAQTTANARIRLFVQEAQPTGGTYIVGDQWYRPSTTLTRYYNGSGWNLLADQTATSGDIRVQNADMAAGDTGWSKQASWAYRPEGFHGRKAYIHGPNNNSYLDNNQRFAVEDGQIIKVVGLAVGFSSANNDCKVVIVFLNSDQTSYLGTYYGSQPATDSGNWERSVLVQKAPAGARWAYVAWYASNTVGNWLVGSTRASILPNDVDEVPHGATYGRTANTDLVDDTGIRRVGLNVKGSRKILGGARNSRASIVAGYNSVRSTTALSADSSGNVTVNAHNVEVSGETVTYNGVTNAITGLTQGVTYTIFTLDPYLDGGTRTYYAQTSVLSAQQAGEGAVHIGNVTIPTSGSSSGGGGGIGDPNDWCVAVDMHMPDGRHAFEVEENEFIECWDELDPPDIELLPVESNELCDGIECIRIETESGAAVVASVCTPMTLRDLSIRRMPDMLGEEVLVRRSFDEMTWERVVKLEYVGKRTVAKIKVHQRCYFAGESPEATIATHNPTQKP